MNQYYQLWKKNGSRWVKVSSITSGGWKIDQAGEYKINLCTSGWWGEPKIAVINEDDLSDKSAFGRTYIAY